MTSAPLAAVSIALAVAGLIVTALGGWPGPMLLAAATLAALASVAIAPTEDPVPTITLTDRGGHFEVAVDYADGRGPQLGLTTPTWRGAQVPEARERGYLEGLGYARSFCRRRWPSAEVTEHGIRPEHARTGA